MQREYNKFTDLNAELLAISVEDLSRPDLAARAEGYPFPVLYNERGDVARGYGVYNQSAAYANPAVFIVDTKGSIVWEHRASAYHRTPLGDIIAQLEKLNLCSLRSWTPATGGEPDGR